VQRGPPPRTGAELVSDVLTSVDGPVGRVRLNRPKALHALTEEMCAAMIDALVAWRADPAVEMVLIDHAEGRGFCAGGDVRAVADSAQGDGVAARRFFHTEYQLNHLLFTYAKPTVAVMDGVVMGGGVGIALPCRHRIATERTVFAMPEATIGLFPDVGGGWYLSRLPGRTGKWLALTAARLDGRQSAGVGIATHLVASAEVGALTQALLDRPREIDAILSPAVPAPLDHQAEIDRLFAPATLEEIVVVLEAEEGEWARETLAALRGKSPQACKVALRLLREAALRTDFADEMRAEYAIASHVCMRHDFIEGVRALLIDKDGAPRWNPATAEEVTEHMLDTIFAPLPESEQWEPIRR
jgi:enoyl-CoA hydratase